MKNIIIAAALLIPLPAFAQSAAPPATKLFSSAADVQALIAKAKAEHKSDAANTVELVTTVQGYPVQLEYRTGTTPPSTVGKCRMAPGADCSCASSMGQSLAPKKTVCAVSCRIPAPEPIDW